jgi:hypothetical protein
MRDLHAILIVQNGKRAQGKVRIDEVATNIPDDEAAYWLTLINKHLLHCRSFGCKGKGDEVGHLVHDFFARHAMVCPCAHPYFGRCAQLVTHLSDSDGTDSTPAPREALRQEGPAQGFDDVPAGVMGCLLWDWRELAVVDLSGRNSPPPSLNMAHYEATGHAVQAPYQDEGPDEVFEFRLVPKVSQSWHPRSGARKDDVPNESLTDEVCAICMECVPARHSTTPCGHHFHTSCLCRWKLVKPECPVCKAGLE